MSKVKSYLQLTRAHTVPLEVVPMVVAAVIATGTIYDPIILFVALLGALYHLGGYGANSYIDWDKGYDKEDPNKTHHPLNTGEISPRCSKVVVVALIASTVGLGIALVNSGIALGFLALAFVSANAYNFTSKLTVWKPLPISIAHSSMVGFSYLVAGGVDMVELWVITAIVFTWVFYQIGVSGEMKDITTDEENLLNRWGTEYKTVGETEYVVSPFSVLGFTLILKASTVGLCIYMFAMLGGEGEGWVMLLLGTWSVYAAYSVIKNGVYKRQERMTNISTVEMVMIAMVSFLLVPVVGLEYGVGLIALSILWVVLFNKTEWGTIIAPEV